MKVKRPCAPRVLVATIAQGRSLLRGFWAQVRASKIFAIVLVATALGIGWSVHYSDGVLLRQLHFWSDAQEAIAHNIAWYLSTFGDYPTYNLPLALLIWLYGVATKSSHWRRVAVVAFLGASLAGLFDDFFRLTLGRPRPDTLEHTHLADGFYGPAYAFSGGYQSFPSGHAASVFGTAIALLLVDLPLGFVTLVFAFAVIWARMELYRHYPSDIVVGVAIGVYFGLMVGLGARRRRTLFARAG